MTRTGGNCHALLRNFRRSESLGFVRRSKRKRAIQPAQGPGLNLPASDHPETLGEEIHLRADGSNWILTHASKEIPTWL